MSVLEEEENFAVYARVIKQEKQGSDGPDTDRATGTPG
jgi:hypothetical protein